MVKILLCCSAGMSTSMLVSKMEQAAKGRGLECEIKAVGVHLFDEEIIEFDVCLLGPQVKYQLDDLSKIAATYSKKVEVIPPTLYGMMKGEEVLDQALSLISK